jgi:hypothetical protein
MMSTFFKKRIALCVAGDFISPHFRARSLPILRKTSLLCAGAQFFRTYFSACS